LSAAWLIGEVGFKDFHDPITGMATWAKQPLVLVNEKAKNTDDLLAFKEKIVTAVNVKFGVVLQQEPELLPKN
jgi:UDP-N-acetylmuramate dehydrogenase